MKNIVIFASGGGSNFKSIHRNIKSEKIFGQIVLLVSNNFNSGAIKYAKNNNIGTFIIKNVKHPNTEIDEDLLIKKLELVNTDLICLAGYVKLLPRKIVRKYKNCILNIHPSLLPRFGGKGFFGIKVHKAVIESGIKESGVTIHFVDEKYDSGKIITQEKVLVRNNYTPKILSKKILEVEHILYSKVVKAFCEDKFFWENNNPKIKH